ncbi:MAG: type II toxin-antitoxin system RelE/ParE family toxin [Patescibacteria group bacterium]
MSNWIFLYTKNAEEDLISLPKDLQKRIAKKMRFFANSDNPLRFSSTIRDTTLGDYRFRIGDYRVVFDVNQNKKEIIVLKIKLRDKVYK